ncbi:Hypothetical protein Minf_1205 [Methylacidiphilum infernorum V4]|uniref:Uncharacterized protein n=1 Tax=Methylacidiphilum infernorum (isolate V4) TaxID=481448 RepID=B3DVA7_METI4|nr:Hypothetical protein Minf_1205 [Methylacidiphilum infernorum V4]
MGVPSSPKTVGIRKAAKFEGVALEVCCRAFPAWLPLLSMTANAYAAINLREMALSFTLPIRGAKGFSPRYK